LRLRLDPVRFVRRYHLYAPLSKISVQGIRVISAVADQPPWLLTAETLLKSLSDKDDLMRRSTPRVYGERKTVKVCQTHELRAFAPLCGAHSARPFFATTNVLSMKHSAVSTFSKFYKFCLVKGRLQ
jgi:hypothetical protein